MQPSSEQALAAAVEPATAEEAVLTTMMSLGRRMRQRLPGEEIDFSALHILKTTSLCGPMRLSALADALELDASTVSRHARHLEDRGLLERTSDPDDGRASRVAVTAHGASCLANSAQLRRAFLGEVMQSWTDDEREQLRSLLTRIHHELSTPSDQEKA